MIRLMLKMLWTRKKRYGWLACELLFVSIILWIILDPLAVLFSIESMPNGFDEKRLYRIELAEYSSKSPRYDPAANDFNAKNENKWRMLQLVRRHPDVAKATFYGPTGPYSMNTMSWNFQLDTLCTQVWGMQLVPGSDYFQTLRFTETDGMTNARLDELLQGQVGESPQKVIISAGTLPGKPLIGQNDTVNHLHVIGTTAMVRMRGGSVPMPVMSMLTHASATQDLVVRLREGVNESDFLPAFNEWAKKQLHAGNYYVRSVQSFSEYMQADRQEVTQQLRVRTILAGFFLLFLFLGVTGTFWMQTRSRCEEIGIMKSFGATSSQIMRAFLTEGLVLVTVTVGAACLLYLHYALDEGLYTPWSQNGNNLTNLLQGRYWFESFGIHFTVVSLLTWTILVVVVSLGIYIPTRQLSHMQPTEALREE